MLKPAGGETQLESEGEGNFLFLLITWCDKAQF